ncbi:MAG TPA: MFS transporter [Candidatus Limnocylindria bacterium]|nr:MFS transporter [Candidatus Limnocylindria bacterium]
MSTTTIWAPERRVLTLGLLGLVTAVAFEGMAVPTVLPATVHELGGLELYGWAFSAFFLTNIVGVTLAGSDADRHGPRRSFLVGLILFAAGLAISGLAPTMPMVIAGRTVQGFGAGAIGSIVYAVIARAYPPTVMARMIAMLSSAWVVPGLVGPALAGLVADHLDWRWVFLGLIPPVAVLGGFVLGPVGRIGPAGGLAGEGRREPTAERRRRAVAAVLLAAGSTLLLAGLSLRDPILAALPLVVGGGWLAAVTLRRLVPPGTLRAEKGRPAVFALIFLVAFGFFGTEAFVPLAVTDVRGSSTTVGGLALSAAAVTWALGAWLPARLTAVTRRGITAVGALGILLGIGVVALVLLPSMPVATAAAGWAIAGLGMGLAYSTLTWLVLQTAPAGSEGVSSAALQLMFTLGTAIGAGVAGALVATAEGASLGLGAAIGWADLVMLLVMLVALASSRRLPAGAAPGAALPLEAAAASPAGSMTGYDES